MTLRKALLAAAVVLSVPVSVEEVFTAYKKRGFNHEGRMACVHC